ncbi:HEAT repeat domain-containing protein [Oscillatoria sp. CS-180]|uniref:HEAT repeat domain-containing protein n=1 Tax=Oscillatoria sp. CS-180 TaxID=3021720 RepID=UPI00232A9BF6|nr:HEAT repeat domain-containing protein [Oscillatoria sp. CS-180]MDB9524446.1 HEAT repeat domain-containing protein [Oscillatoria sp. CS-180]
MKSNSPKLSADTAATQYLESTLDQLIEGDFQARWEATKRLSTIGIETIAHLIPLLEDKELDWEIRWFAARVLGGFDDERALEALIQLLQKTREPDLIAIAAEGISRFHEKGVDALAILLSTPQHCITAVHALASIQHQAAFEPLFAAAKNSDPAVRTAAIAALSNFRDPKVDDLLIKALKDPVAKVRQEAIVHLGLRSYLLEEMDLVSLVAPGLWDLHPDVNQATAIALSRLGTQAAVTDLANVLSSPHTPESLQFHIVRALGWIETDDSLLVLFSAYQSVSLALQIGIVEALSQLQSLALQERASEVLYDWLKSAIADINTDAKLKQAIALALGNLHSHQAEPLLQQLTQDANKQTCLYAEAALRKLAEG